MTSIEAVLFDIDGTLVDSNDLHVLAWEQAFRDAGAVFERATIRQQIGKGTDMLVPTLMPGIDAAAQERIGETQGTVFKARYLDQVKPFTDARATLARVREAGQRVVLASSASGEALDHYLGLLDARDLVAATTTADDVERTKPAPDIFAVALKKVGVAADRAVVVGDTPYDMAAAVKCGIAGVAVRSGGFDEGGLRQAGTVTVYDDVAALLADYDRSPLAAR